MQKMNIVQIISVGGILTAITVLFQSAPVFLPGIGMAFSPFSTLPIAIATVMSLFLGILVLFASTLIILMVSAQEAMILIFATGILGFVLGAALYRKGLLITLLASSLALTIGMLALTYIVTIPGFSEITGSLRVPLIVLIYFLFSFLYSTIWFLGLKKFLGLLAKIKMIEKPLLHRNNSSPRHPN
ncbi:MAG: hypothetical protein K0R34_300 [Herbinix sp.]|jgi:hypothetical protein|nr:hypothetical protein [Herbinix sp.]